MAKNSQFLQKNSSLLNIYGYHSVKAALKNDKRRKKRLILNPTSAENYYDEFKGKIEEIIIIPQKEFKNKYSKDENTQGIVLQAFDLKELTLKEILKNSSKNKESILLLLDQVNDPHNIGAIMRSAALFNCLSIIISENNSPEMNSTIIKSASGAAEIVSLIKVPNISRCINELKKNDYWIIGLDSEADKTLDKFDIPKKSVFVLGSEHSGLRELTKKNCDYKISIKNKQYKYFEIDSLNVSNAASIALYEYNKKYNIDY